MTDRSNGGIPTPSLNLDLSGTGPERNRVLSGLFTREALSRGAVHFERVGWLTDTERLPDLGTTIASEVERWSETRLISEPPALALATLSSHGLCRFHATLAAPDRRALDELSARLRELLPEARPPEDRKVAIHFWAGGDEVAAISKRLAVEPWAEIEANYAASTREDLGRLMDDFAPGEGGKLLLWHGEPGTGKTYALRTLAWEWRSWCEFHYVIDPEVLLGPNSAYLVRVLLNDQARLGMARERLGKTPQGGSRWRLLILEDCGELLAADAKAATGQALSRLLNLTDGLIGEGFKTLILISTNDPLKRMHPAVTREGREAARVGFEKHSRAETREWLRTHGIDDEPDAGMTLAGLFAAAAGRRRQRPLRSVVGFGADG